MCVVCVISHMLRKPVIREVHSIIFGLQAYAKEGGVSGDRLIYASES